MSPKPRPVFTDEQKSEVVKIVAQSGKPIAQLAQEMGLTESALRNWVKQVQIDQAASPQSSSQTRARRNEGIQLCPNQQDAERSENQRMGGGGGGGGGRGGENLPAP